MTTMHAELEAVVHALTVARPMLASDELEIVDGLLDRASALKALDEDQLAALVGIAHGALDDNDMSLRPRPGETAADVIERVTRAAKA